MTSEQLEELIMRAFSLGKLDDREVPTFTGLTVKACVQGQPIPYELRGTVWQILRQAYLWGAFVARFRYSALAKRDPQKTTAYPV